MAQVSGVKNASFPSNNKWSNYGNYYVSGTPAPANEDNYAFASMMYSDQAKVGHSYDISCKWEPLRDQILSQWPRISRKEVDEAGPNRSYLAMLISVRYGLDSRIIRNYLRNLERNLPLMGN